MIDESDADFSLLMGASTPGGCGLVLILIAIVLYFVAFRNEGECSKKHCDVGKPALVHHECICETPAK